PEEGREEEEGANDELGVGNDESEEETGGSSPEPKKRTFLPASIGLTVFVPVGVEKLVAVVRYADYARPEVDDEATPERSGKKGRARNARTWKRVPMPPVTEVLDLTDDSLSGEGIAVRDARGLRLLGQIGVVNGVPGVPDGTQAVSIFLVNRRAPESQGFRDAAYVFQVEIELCCAAGFFGRGDQSSEDSDESDDKVGDLQYRNSLEYGVGHGVSVEIPEGQGESVTRVRTTWIPNYEVRRVIAREELSVTVSMELLANLTTPEDVLSHLARLPAAYGEWLASRKTILVGEKGRTQTQAELLHRAEAARLRIAEGLEILATREDVRDAFCLANRAMAMAARKKRPHQEPSWRLFQLAFVLLNLAGLADPTHPDREKAELIFFPTGGGKTEAYLGVIATTLVLRRLRAQDTPHRGLGVAVILRYTLRLLTLDQLGRAATLICALELLRKQDPRRLGPERFSVGLWVGSSATANTMAQVQKDVLKFQAKNGGNPAPLMNCPWCDAELTATSITLQTDGKTTAKDPEQIRVACVSDVCEFCAAKNVEGIPVLFVDEQVYRELPSFLIGTVDKFAMIPWRGETGKLFGKVTGRVGSKFFNATDGSLPKGATPLPNGTLPPELVVQDELHLISGPLGTMVGLYETAVDYLSSQELDGKTVRPKVIAATATVRRAAEQIQALYGKNASDVCIFPPPGVDAMDTYFSLVDRESPGRLYLGVAAQGRSMKAILLRVYRSLLASSLHAYDTPGAPEQTKDAYTTVAGYFNSLRELGGMRRIAEDELIGRSKKAEDFHPLDFKGIHPWFKNRKVNGEPVELTSRESTDKIKKSKDRLNQAFRTDGHVDVLLASNMISVGVDIDRLGLMVVAGQPKTTAEYIQASSRVGRQADRPGLVVTCMNLHKPRDRSHYEHFAHYHQSFYRNVEATSVTPFSGPALDRGLAGTLVAMARFTTPEMTPAGGAMNVANHKLKLEKILDVLGKRAGKQPGKDRKQEAELVSQVRGRARNLLETWENITRSTEAEPVKRRYSRFDKDKSTGGPTLLYQALDENAPERNSPEGRFCAPTSMRDVEATAHLWVTKALGPFESPGSQGNS
ncbi:MAG: hypothetical protein RJA70_2234, partial [Pseudomonadota bacterium]